MVHQWVKTLCDVRRYLRMSQVEFAVLCEVSPRTVQRWESGDYDRTIPFGAVRVLSEYLSDAGYVLVVDNGELRMTDAIEVWTGVRPNRE